MSTFRTVDNRIFNHYFGKYGGQGIMKIQFPDDFDKTKIESMFGESDEQTYCIEYQPGDGSQVYFRIIGRFITCFKSQKNYLFDFYNKNILNK